MPKATSKSFTRDIWLYDQIDFVRFNHMLTDINWNEKLCNFDDVDDMCEEFLKISFKSQVHISLQKQY